MDSRIQNEMRQMLLCLASIFDENIEIVGTFTARSKAFETSVDFIPYCN